MFCIIYCNDKYIRNYIRSELKEFAYYYEDFSQQRNKLIMIDHKPNLDQTNKQLYQKIKLPIIYVQFSKQKIPNDYIWPQVSTDYTYFNPNNNTICQLSSLKNSPNLCRYCGNILKMCLHCNQSVQQCLYCYYVENEKREMNKLYVMYCYSCI